MCILTLLLVSLSKDFIYLTMMVSWLVNLPWKREKAFDLVEYFAGVARVSRLAHSCGYNTSAFDMTYDEAPPGQSQHAGRAKRSAFDINGEGGFLLLIWMMTQFNINLRSLIILKLLKPSHSGLQFSWCWRAILVSWWLC